MNRLFQKLTAFMYGRYGRDELGIAIIILWCITAIINIFVNSIVLPIIGLIFAAIAFYRMMSKNIYRRQSENRKFLAIWMPIKRKLSAALGRIRDLPNFCYLKCPACKTTLRVKRIKGSHTVACPKCGNKFGTKIRFGGKAYRTGK